MRDQNTVKQIMQTTGIMQILAILGAFLYFEKPFEYLKSKSPFERVEPPLVPKNGGYPKTDTPTPLTSSIDVVTPNVPTVHDEARQDIQI
jgi:hypothetical protein